MNFLVLQHVDCEGLGLWEAWCREAGIGVEIVSLHRGTPLPAWDRFQGVISLGGPMNVYQEEAYPFLKTEYGFIRQALDLGVPFLGICLGGQLLAKALGGTVTQNPVKEIGWHTVELDPMGQRDPLFAGLPERFPVFQWHGDAFGIPRGAIRLASSPACENQAFRFGFGGIAYALQFHLEVTPLMVEAWAHEYAGELDGTADAAGLLAETHARCADLAPVSRRVFQNFCRLVELRYTGVGAATPVDSPRSPKPRGTKAAPDVAQAWQAYRMLMAKGKLRCGVTCPLDRIGHCTGGCW